MFVQAVAIAKVDTTPKQPSLKPGDITGLQSIKKFGDHLQALDKLLCKKIEVKSKKHKSIKEMMKGVGTSFTLTNKEKNDLISACNPLKEGINQFLVDYNALQAKMSQRDQG